MTKTALPTRKYFLFIFISSGFIGIKSPDEVMRVPQPTVLGDRRGIKFVRQFGAVIANPA